MDIMMVEQAQMEPSCKRPDERPAGSCNKKGFGRHMDSALEDGGRLGVDKTGPAGVAGTQSSDVAYESEASDPSQAQPSKPNAVQEVALQAGPAGEEDLRPASVEEYPDEAGSVSNPYALGVFLTPVLQQSPVKPIAIEIKVAPASIVGSEGRLNSGTLIEASGASQYLSLMAQNGGQTDIAGPESASKSGEAIDDQGSGEIDMDDLARAFESTENTGLQAGLEGSTKVPHAAETSSQEIPGLTIERQADRTLSGLSAEAGEEGFSLEGLAEDVEMPHEEVSVGGATQGSGGSGERDGFQPGNSGNEGNSDPSFGSGAQTAAQIEARTAAGFSLNQIDQTGQIGAPQSPRTAESSIVETEVIDRFADGVRLSVSNGMKEVRINMHPEELGGVTIRLRVDNGTVSAHVLVDSQSVKGIFDSDTGRLRDVFAQNGLVLDSFSVGLSSDQGHTGGSSGGQSHRWGEATSMPPRFAYQEAPSLDSGQGAQSLTGIGRPVSGIDLFA